MGMVVVFWFPVVGAVGMAVMLLLSFRFPASRLVRLERLVMFLVAVLFVVMAVYGSHP